MIWERLYELSDKSILHISREADEGWNYALYHRCSVGEYTLADGGYIDGHTTDPIDDIAYISTQLLGTSVPVKTSLTVKEFQDYIKQVPDAIHRGVNIFLSPELKSAGIENIPESLLTEIRQAIDRRLSQDILLIYHADRFSPIFCWNGATACISSTLNRSLTTISILSAFQIPLVTFT